MKKHEIIQVLVDKEAEQQGYSIDERDAFMAGISAWVEYHEDVGYKCKKCEDTKKVGVTNCMGMMSMVKCPFCQ